MEIEEQRDILELQFLKEKELEEERKKRFNEKTSQLRNEVNEWQRKCSEEDRKAKSLMRKLAQERVAHQKEMMELETRYKKEYKEKEIVLEKTWTQDMKDYRAKMMEQDQLIYT